MTDADSIRTHIARCRAELLAAADAVPSRQWQDSPGAGRWSAAEILAHVTMVEQAITAGARKVLAAEPRRYSLWQRLHPPVSIVAWRGFRRETPIPLDRTLLAECTTMQQRLAEARARTLALLEENAARDLRRWYWPHPFLGPLNYYQWFRLLGYHDSRHAKQMREVTQALRR
ncbi:MAG: DinB family protein [Candidatus Acidiferrales bacterium]